MPMVDCGRYPVKRVAGEPCVVEADIFRDGDHVLHAVIKWRPQNETQFSESPMIHVDNDRWRGEFPLDRNDRYFFTIEAWTDLFASWERGFRKKAEAGRDVASDLLEGIVLIEAAGRHAGDTDRTAIDAALERLRALREPRHAVAIVSDEQLLGLMARLGDRFSATEYRPLLEVVADRPLARCGAWYEMFPRSQGEVAGRAATLREAERRLPEIRDLGFDVVYLAPIHPIGHTYRKGPNNSLTPLPTVRAAPGRSEARPAAIQRSSRRSAPWTISIILSWPRGASDSKSRSTSQFSARPTIPGCASIPSGSAIGPTARSSMLRIRPRNIRISTRSTSRRRRPGP